MPQWWMPAVQKQDWIVTFDDTWFEYGLGAAVQTGKNNYFYVDVERSAGSDYEKRLAVECRSQMEFLNNFFDFRQGVATLQLA